jgi:hypothetical protein
MKVAVVFDTPHPEWQDADYQREIAEGKVQEAEYDVARALMQNDHEVRLVGIVTASDGSSTRSRPSTALVFNCCRLAARNTVRRGHGSRDKLAPRGHTDRVVVARNKSMSRRS